MKGRKWRNKKNISPENDTNTKLKNDGIRRNCGEHTKDTHTLFFYEVEISKKKLSQEKPFVNAVVKV